MSDEVAPIIPVQEIVPTEKIISDGKNPNKLPKHLLQALIKNIKQYGFLVPILVNKEYVIADGEHRLQAAKEIGMKEVPVIRLDVSEVDRRMLRQIMNKLKGEHDKDLDMIEYQFIQDEGMFERFRELLPSVSNYEHLLDKAGQVDPDAFNTERAVAQPKYNVSIGDVYQLGDHRLMCGDSTNAEHVKDLMGNAKANAVITDPPYGVSYTGDSHGTGKEWEMIKNDDLRGDALKVMIGQAFINAHANSENDVAVYCFYASVNHIEFENALNGAGFRVKQQLIWDKGHVIGRSDYHWVHEPCLYCVKHGHNSNWYGDRTQKTLLENNEPDFENLTKEKAITILKEIYDNGSIIRIKRDAGSTYIHPTQKPVDLAKRFIFNSTERGHVVLDLFGGSGSTLIACEQTNREARIMELDPRYVSAIIERWESFTGFSAVKVQ